MKPLKFIMNDVKKWYILFAGIILIVMYGCKAPVIVVPPVTIESEIKSDQKDIQLETEKEELRLKKEQAAKEKIEKAKKLELLKKEKIALEVKKQSVNRLIKNINGLGEKTLHTLDNIKLANGYLTDINDKSLAYDDFSTAVLLIKKGKILFLLDRSEEALIVLNKNWKLIVAGDKQSSLNSPPSAEAYLLLGNLNISLANSEKDTTKATKLYKNAAKSYYKVLTLYDSKDCPFSGLAIKGFRDCKKFMKKRFNYNLSFPPEM